MSFRSRKLLSAQSVNRSRTRFTVFLVVLLWFGAWDLADALDIEFQVPNSSEVTEITWSEFSKKSPEVIIGIAHLLPCNGRLLSRWVELSLGCMLNGKLPQFSLQDQAQILSRSRSSFTDQYDLNALDFRYHPSQIFTTQTRKEDIIRQQLTQLTTGQKVNLITAVLTGKRATFSYQWFVKQIGLTGSIYVVDSQLGGRGPCTQQNYRLALSKLQGYVLQPGQSLNYNTLLSWAKGYCTGSTKIQYQFYGGVCGAATQLFRSALLAPGLSILKRSNHAQRYSAYYGEAVLGDDAALYEDQKSLIIKNTTSAPFVFALVEHAPEIFLVAYTPIAESRFVQITKQTGENLQAWVTKSLLDPRGQLLFQSTRSSKYTSVNVSPF